MKGAGNNWPDGRRRCDGVNETEGRRCFDVGRYGIAGDVAPLRYCHRHGAAQAKMLGRELLDVLELAALVAA